MALPIFIAGSSGLILTLLLILLCMRSGCGIDWLQRPADWHHAHRGKVPRLGGLVLAAAFAAVEFGIATFYPELRASTPARNVIVFGSLAMFALGFWDDIRSLGASTKLLCQILIAATVCSCGVRIEILSLPLTTAPLQLGAWGPIVTVIWLVGLANLINLSDGLDGLAGGICFMLVVLMAVVGHQGGHFELLAWGMAGALAGFLWFNFPPARVYLGDGGAYFLGFQVGLYSIVNSHNGADFGALAAPLFVLALPVTDALLTILRRGLRGLPLFRPDRKHLHHRLLAVGVSPRKVLLLVYTLNLAFLLMALAAFWSHGKRVPGLLVLAALLLFACAGTFGFSRRWFAIHRVVRSSLRMRREIRYALSLTHWLELESRRHPGPAELWPGFVFAANKLGFASLKLTLEDEHRFWQRPTGPSGSARCRYDCPNGSYGSIEFTSPPCSLIGSRRARSCEQDGECGGQFRGCLAEPRLFETISELLAEAWSRSAAGWSERRVPLRFDDREPQPPASKVAGSAQTAAMAKGVECLGQIGEA